jgi:hypothetical protein
MGNGKTSHSKLRGAGMFYTKSMDVLAGQIEASPSLDEIQSLMDEIFDRRFNDELDEAALSVLKAAVIRFAELGKLEGSYAAVEANLQRLKSKGKLYGREYERFVEPVLEKLMASEDLSNLRVFADKIKKEYPTGAALALIKSASIRVEQNLYADAQELWVEVEAIASQILPEKKDDLIHVYREMAVVERKLELAGVFSSEKNAILSEKIENEDLEKINQFLENAYFSKAKHRYQRRINLNMLRLPEPLNDADFSALAPFVTFLDHPLLAIVRPQTVSSLQSLLNSWTMSETEDFFDVINELNPRLIDVERFNTWLFKWATLFNGLRDHDGGLYLMIKKLTKAHSGVFWADEFDATHLPESMQDAALLMIVHYLRSGESESLLEEVSSIDDLRSQVSETNRRLERFSVAEINAIYNAELSESAGDVDPRTNWKKIKSMSDYLDYRSRIKPIHDRDLDILSMQINKAIEGQDNSPDISQRELIQNSLKAHAQAKIKEPIVVRSFIRKGAKHEWVKSVADKAGMELQDILGPLLVLDERAEITEADMSRGFFGIGFFTTFKDFDRVRLITSKGKGFPLYYLEFWRDPETKRIQVSIEEDEKNDLQYRGTIVEGIKEVDPNQNPIAQFIMANDNLLRYVAAVQDTPIIANGKPINEVLQTMGKVNTAYGELRLSTSLSGRKRVVLNGLFVESPEHENYFALVPKVYRDILFQSGMTLELPEKVSLTSSRNTLAKKEEVLPEIQRAVALASYQMIINLFLYDNVYPLGLTQDYLGEDNVSVDADVAQDAALIKQGLFNQVNFFNYVAGEDALENEKMIKNRKMIELLTVIEVDDRANPGFKTSLDNERLKVLGKKEGDFSGTSLTAKYYAEHGKALSERQNDFKPYAPEVLNQPRLQAFITLGDVLLEMMGESGVAIVLGESTTKDIPAFFMPLFNTISWDLAMTEIEHLTTHFYRIVAGESFDAEDLYSFFYHYTDILFHEAAHVYSGAHQREKMEGLFGWHKDQLLKKFLLNQTSLQQVVEEVRKRMTTEGTPLSSEASATPQNFLGYRAELRVVEEIARLRRNINKGRILGMKGKEMTPDEKMQILGRLKEIENSPNILDAHFDTFARAEKMSEFQQRLKDALIEEHPDLRDKLFFISRKSIDGFIAWLLIEPVPDSRTMGVSDLLVNERNAETRPVLFIGADYNDITTLFVTAHEVAHFLQKDTDGVGRVEKMHRWFVEGYQKHREMEVLMSLYKSSETMRVAVDELYRDFSEEHLLSEHVSERAGDVDEASILEKLTAMSSSVAGGYPHETIFVEALIAKLGESNGHEALRDIHQDGDYAKLESFLGKEKTDELRAVFMSARILRVYPLLEFISKSVALSWVLYFIEEDVSAEKSQKIKSVLETLPLKLGMHVNKLSEVQRKLLEMNTQLLIKSFDRTLWEADGELNVESALSKMKAVLEKNIESAASTTRGKLLIALSEMRPGDASSEGTEESGDGTRGELRSSDKISPDVLSRSELRLHLPDAVKRANRFFQKPYILGADGSLDFMRIIKDNVLAKFNITEEIFKSMENLDAVLELMRRGEKMNAFEKQIKQSLIALYPDLEKTLFFIPDDDGDTHGDVYWRMMHPGDRKAMGFLTTLDNGREERVVVFVRTGEGDLQTLVTAVHEVAHFLQDRSLLENYRLPLHRWLVEGYQKRREIEILSELYHGSPQIQASVDELINAELLTPTLTLFGRRRKANDPTIINLSIDERIKILSNDWTEHLYVHEGNFVDALIEAMGEEALRDIHQRADYTKMEDAIGQEKIEALRALFINWTLDSISNQGHPTLGFVLPILAVHLIISEKDFDQTKREKVQKFSRDLHRRLSDSLIPRYENLYMIPPLRARFESALIQVWNVYKNDGTEFEEMLKDMMQREIDYFDAESDDEDLEDDSAAGNVMSELRSELSEAEYLPQVTLKDRARDYSQNELVRLVTFVREHNIPDDVLLGSVSDSLDQLKKSRQPLKPFEIPRAVKVIDQVFDLIDEEITLLITESNIIPYHHDLLVIENSTGRLVAAAPIQIWGAGAARRIMPMWSRTFVQGQGYLQRAIQLLLKSKKIAGWRTEALDEGGDTRTGGVSEMYERMLATGDFERVNIRGTYHSVVQLKDRSELRIFAGEEPIIVPFRREDQRNLGKGTVEPLTPVGLVSRGIRFLTPEMYLDIRQNGFLAPNKRSVESGGSFSKFLDKVSLSISQNERFRSSATHTYGPFLGFGEDIIPIGDHASFVIRRSYIKDHSDDFQLAGRLLDQEESFRKEYQQGLDLIGLGDKQVYIKTDVAFPDEIHADAVPAEAIGGIIVHESLARKIAEWDKQFNLESLPPLFSDRRSPC